MIRRHDVVIQYSIALFQATAGMAGISMGVVHEGFTLFCAALCTGIAVRSEYRWRYGR